MLNGDSVTFGYDNAHQVTIGAGVTYGYDSSGNRNNMSQSISTGNRLDADLVWTYTYDDEGNLTRRSKGTNAETWDYTYDHRNQMVSATKKATQAGAATWIDTYTYDAFGNRIKQEIDADGAGGGSTTTTKFAYDGMEVWADLDSGGNLQTRYVKGDQIDELFARVSAGGTAAWYLTDRMGSVRNILNSSGSVLGTVAYDAFGQITSDTTGGNGDRWKWTGREFDAALGLQFNRWRYYNPETGKWTSEDPIRIGSCDPNYSRYSTNSPTLFGDPDGLLAMPGQGGGGSRDGSGKDDDKPPEFDYDFHKGDPVLKALSNQLRKREELGDLEKRKADLDAVLAKPAITEKDLEKTVDTKPGKVVSAWTEVWMKGRLRERLGDLSKELAKRIEKLKLQIIYYPDEIGRIIREELKKLPEGSRGEKLADYKEQMELWRERHKDYLEKLKDYQRKGKTSR